NTPSLPEFPPRNISPLETEESESNKVQANTCKKRSFSSAAMSVGGFNFGLGGVSRQKITDLEQQTEGFELGKLKKKSSGEDVMGTNAWKQGGEDSKPKVTNSTVLSSNTSASMQMFRFPSHPQVPARRSSIGGLAQAQK